MSYELQNCKENFTVEVQFSSKTVLYSSPGLFQDNDLSSNYEFCVLFIDSATIVLGMFCSSYTLFSFTVTNLYT